MSRAELRIRTQCLLVGVVVGKVVGSVPLSPLVKAPLCVATVLVSCESLARLGVIHP